MKNIIKFLRNKDSEISINTENLTQNNTRQKYSAIFDRYDFQDGINKIWFFSLKDADGTLLKEYFYIDANVANNTSLIGFLMPDEKIVFLANIQFNQNNDPDFLQFNNFSWGYNNTALFGVNDDISELTKKSAI